MTALSLTHQGATLIRTTNGKRCRTLPVAAWKKILRLQREARAEGWRTVFVCPVCQDPISLVVPHPTEPHLACRCTEWIGR